ncbi:MAG: helix-turn-helix domain-containing protein [Clostridiales bacterium]|nr:helix-turn-helix domain-containing protein [Clostridiales bacterium]
MIVKKEIRHYDGEERVWTGKYRNVNNQPHWHTELELVVIDNGQATFNVENKLYELTEGQSILIPSSAIHQITSTEDSTLSFFIFQSKPIHDIVGNKRLCSPVLNGKYLFDEIYASISADLRSKSRLEALSANNRIERLMLDIFLKEETIESRSDTNYMQVRYKRLLEDIDENYGKYTIVDAARFSALSVSYFSKFFKQMAGMTFTQYLNLVRVEKAIELIKANEVSMTTVAISCGFGTIRNFNRVFKSTTGYSPRELPDTYSVLSLHPNFGVEDTFDPTSPQSKLVE